MSDNFIYRSAVSYDGVKVTGLSADSNKPRLAMESCRGSCPIREIRGKLRGIIYSRSDIESLCEGQPVTIDEGPRELKIVCCLDEQQIQQEALTAHQDEFTPESINAQVERTGHITFHRSESI